MFSIAGPIPDLIHPFNSASVAELKVLLQSVAPPIASFEISAGSIKSICSFAGVALTIS